MLSYIKGHMTSIEGIEIFPLISFLIFFAFFIGLIWYVIRVDKDKINEIKNIPLENENTEL
jgi:cytochrome c oxidase cbb3-type subunit IV